MNFTIANTSIRTDVEGRYCLNDLHKAAGGENRHRPSLWVENQQTKDLIAEIDKAGIPAIHSKQGLGTFVCKELVYSFAMWISPAFHLQVIRTFDAVTTGNGGSQDRSARPRTGNSALDKLRTANALKLAEETAARICARFENLGDSAKQVIYAKIINPIAGSEVIGLPALTERHYTATQVGERFGITAAMVGRIAGRHSLKTKEYGDFFLDKSPHSSKEVEAFRYNERGAEKIGELASAAVATAVVVNKALPSESSCAQLFE